MLNTGEDLNAEDKSVEDKSDEDWSALLGALTIEELRHYGRISLDQVVRAGRWFWVQIVVLALTLGLACWGLWSGLKTGIRLETLYWAGPGLLAVYWLYRSAKARRLWSMHFDAVNGELSRRGEGLMNLKTETK